MSDRDMADKTAKGVLGPEHPFDSFAPFTDRGRGGVSYAPG